VLETLGGAHGMGQSIEIFLVLKLDFDKIEHSTILKILKEKGFGDKWNN
jgi:hypothetical protein